MLKFLDLSVKFTVLPRASKERGASLIVVMLLLVIVSILGISGVQISMMAERGTRNDRDTQIAWQSTEAALMDAEFDILGQPASSSTKRNSIFKRGSTDISQFVQDCGTSGNTIGLCALNATGKPAWLAVDFTITANNAPTTVFGTYTGRTFPSGNAGIQPAQPPRYVIEPIPDPSMSRTKDPKDVKYIYRITAMGFGPNADTQTVSQVIFRN
ncbi:PilX N-terminal domain-containing pilus assembly protein [Acidovorax sp. SUPP2539]|uniref:pilus assembly PilX family protein n=1 Tax=Acidovorax sp. SUPP2539 TaxID=2920878 RepID=UPI0023DE3612|nr:PilX N-terminal domain-containing pilus assembly protein [Acidovorax sp. SUPP2539]GKS90410.1 pilus assembly protein [Acidovorax sp. SUPP2539]